MPDRGVGGEFGAGLGAEAGRALEPGAVLNNIWLVRRLHASGGMSEVYEGAHVNTDERVAIKVLLPHIAADPKIKGLLLSEARKMTRIRHDAIVHYIMMAEEPDRRLSYIVMDFIDGVGLDKVVGVIRPTQGELVALMRRLARGLEAAHLQRVFHRDMSPDNVILPQRRLAEAKIIDFGIAKDLDPTHSTIIGAGFAGKIGFAAPEQFGEYDRAIGPWTDIYSLGLTLLSLAVGQQVDMGKTLSEAIDRRRAGPDFTGLAPVLRPLFERMLQADPKARFASVADLALALDGLSPPDAGRGAPPPVRDEAADERTIIERPNAEPHKRRPPAQPVPEQAPPIAASRKRPRAGVWISASVIGFGVLALVAVLVGSHRPSQSASPAADAEASAQSLAPPSQSASAPPQAQPPATPAQALIGAWGVGGTSGCATPVTLSVNGDQLTLNFLGHASVSTLHPAATPGEVDTTAGDGEYRYVAAGDGTLSVDGPKGMSMKLKKCPG